MTPPAVRPVGMSSAGAKRAAILGPVAAVILAYVANTAGTRRYDMGRVVTGALIVMVLLSLLAEASPPVAGGFAALLIVTGFFVLGEPAWSALQKAL